jgi:hypothetical protein
MFRVSDEDVGQLPANLAAARVVELRCGDADASERLARRGVWSLVTDRARPRAPIQATALPVVGTGVDPVTSRFQVGCLVLARR